MNLGLEETALDRSHRFGRRPVEDHDSRQAPPPLPTTVEETGISTRMLQSLLLKSLHRGGIDTLPGLVETMRLPSAIVSALLQEAVEQNLLKVTGSRARSTLPVLTYSLTVAGRATADEAWERSRYVGPAPVSLRAYSERIEHQRLHFDHATPALLKRAFADLVLGDELIDKIGPAVNAGRSLLLYGAPGNGKSSIARRIGRVFPDIVYIPYSVEVEGQIIQIFDPNLHEPAEQAASELDPAISIRHEDVDARWVACRRPVIITGGEFTLDMLDLRYLEVSNFYEAPLHVKAMGGTFVIDDFGRQFVRPKDLLNRWMIPLEEKHDYLRLHTGATFSLPFDELVIFCTNLTPADLMDAAFLRRIPYKIRLAAPPIEIYRDIFKRAAADRGLTLAPLLFDWIVDELQSRRRVPLACYQPKFIIDHIVETCAFRKRPPEISESLVSMALDNLYTASS